MTPGRGALRFVRAALFAVSAVGLAAAAHLAGGELVPVPALLLAVPVVMIVVNLLAGARRGPVALFAGMGLTQAVLHVAFMVTSSPALTCLPTAPMPTAAMPASQMPGPRMSMAGMSMTGEHGHAVLQCMPTTGHLAAGGFWPSGPMLLAHLVATAVLVLLLARGEAAVWALAADLAFRFRLPVVPVLPPGVRPVPVTAAAAGRPAGTVHLRTVRRRGPPVPAAG